ncbi:MAG: rod shape-determining protein RodA [Deltaproteobacteria bacterium]|nr:rod shape-determining protein RodA [Candidatus Anaeroferrophillacea bacterium]
MSIRQPRISRIDGGLLLLCVILFTLGCLTIYSAAFDPDMASWLPHHCRRQLLWFVVGIGGMTIGFAIDYHLFEKIAYPVYALALILLVLVLLMGRTSMGATRWLTVAGLTFQPSELAKLAVIMALARYFSRRRIAPPYNLRELVIPFGLVAFPFLLIIRQPDLGTAMLVALISAAMIFAAGITRHSMTTICGLAGAAAAGGWHFLHDYQQQRILTFISPEMDPRGAGYHIAQSKIAVGSGGIWGKGFLKGTQTLLHFLPEQHTDFIFAVYAEQWGFLGGSLLIAVFLLFLLRGLTIGTEARDPFGSYLAIGITATFFWQFFINIGMVIGLMPVVGIPLPLFSYGGTSLLTSLTLIGILLNIHFRKKYF